MSTQDLGEALSPDVARQHAARVAFGGDDARTVGRVGLESEFFVVYRRGDRPAGRVPLAGPEGVWAVLDRLARREPWIEPRGTEEAPVYPLTEGGRLTFEPGGQLEISTAARDSLAVVLAEWETLGRRLRREFARQGAVLASLGFDPWHEPATVPLQLAAPRYRTMTEYLARRGPAGVLMMRHTASCQVNLDLGPAEEHGPRWLLANLASPWITATFAASPWGAGASGRARIWQRLDPTRTGFPPLTEGREGSGGDYADAALAADVMLFRGAGAWESAHPGFPFHRWIREGHPRHGRPTAGDLDYHLTTLFFEVRPRGFLEFRAADALPPPWHGVAAVLLAGLFYGRGSVERGLSLLTPFRERLPELWARAAENGVRDADLGGLAPRLWATALDGVESLPSGYVRPEDVRRAVAFVERYPARRRMPADLLAQARDPSETLRWAAGEEEEA